jgi:serine/threonine protein kinase
MIAIKRMSKQIIRQMKLETNIKLERDIMLELHSNFIERLSFCFRDEHYYYMAMEWAE